jgi:hypothetical protein
MSEMISANEFLSHLGAWIVEQAIIAITLHCSFSASVKRSSADRNTDFFDRNATKIYQRVLHEKRNVGKWSGYRFTGPMSFREIVNRHVRATFC